eukprot:5066176-Pyramimonas_sp.AAC.1
MGSLDARPHGNASHTPPPPPGHRNAWECIAPSSSAAVADSSFYHVLPPLSSPPATPESDCRVRANEANKAN